MGEVLLCRFNDQSSQDLELDEMLEGKRQFMDQVTIVVVPRRACI